MYICMYRSCILCEESADILELQLAYIPCYYNVGVADC